MPTAWPQPATKRPMAASVRVLDSAIDYAHAALHHARGCPSDVPTPCAGWDLAALLIHMEDSLSAIGEAALVGRVSVEERPGRLGTDGLVQRVVQRACRTRSAWVERITSAPVDIGDLALDRETVVLLGALEIAVHGWDVAQTIGRPQPLPDELARGLTGIAHAVVTPVDRGHRFGPVIEVPPTATAGTRLLAHLGRR